MQCMLKLPYLGFLTETIEMMFWQYTELLMQLFQLLRRIRGIIWLSHQALIKPTGNFIFRYADFLVCHSNVHSLKDYLMLAIESN